MANPLVKSAARAIEVLERFAALRKPLSLKEICDALGYPQSSTTVLLKTLTTLGYLTYDRRRRVYFPALRVTALGDWVPQALLGQGKVLEVMRDVHNATGETTSIAIQNDIYLQYIQLIQSVHALRFHVDEGTLRPLTHSAVGWLLMSTLKDAQVENIVRRARIAVGRATPSPTVAEMMAIVAKNRRDKFSYAENVPFLGGATICVLLPITILDQPVVLGVGGALERVRANRTRYLSVLRQASRALQPVKSRDHDFEIEF